MGFARQTSGGTTPPKPGAAKPAAKPGKFASPEEAMMAIEQARAAGDAAALEKVITEACKQFPDLALCRQRVDSAMNKSIRSGFGRPGSEQAGS